MESTQSRNKILETEENFITMLMLYLALNFLSLVLFPRNFKHSSINRNKPNFANFTVTRRAHITTLYI